MEREIFIKCENLDQFIDAQKFFFEEDYVWSTNGKSLISMWTQGYLCVEIESKILSHLELEYDSDNVKEWCKDAFVILDYENMKDYENFLEAGKFGLV